MPERQKHPPLEHKQQITYKDHGQPESIEVIELKDGTKITRRVYGKPGKGRGKK